MEHYCKTKNIRWNTRITTNHYCIKILDVGTAESLQKFAVYWLSLEWELNSRGIKRSVNLTNEWYECKSWTSFWNKFHVLILDIFNVLFHQTETLFHVNSSITMKIKNLEILALKEINFEKEYRNMIVKFPSWVGLGRDEQILE